MPCQMRAILGIDFLLPSTRAEEVAEINGEMTSIMVNFLRGVTGVTCNNTSFRFIFIFLFV